MKIWIAGIICLLGLTGVLVYAHAQTSNPTSGPSFLAPGAVGRYQIVAMDFDESSMSGVMKHKTAIRVDTQTGATWELVELQGKSGGRNFYWEPLSEEK